MVIKSLHQITTRLDSAFKSSEMVADDEIKSHLSRYLCVLVSGFIEESIKIIIMDYVASRSHPRVINHTFDKLKKETNFNYNKILAFLYTFDPKWSEELTNCITEEEKDSINSIISNRHNIAHGGNVGVTFSTIKNWYKNSKSVIIKIENVVKNY